MYFEQKKDVLIKYCMYFHILQTVLYIYDNILVEIFS